MKKLVLYVAMVCLMSSFPARAGRLPDPQVAAGASKARLNWSAVGNLLQREAAAFSSTVKMTDGDDPREKKRKQEEEMRRRWQWEEEAWKALGQKDWPKFAREIHRLSSMLSSLPPADQAVLKEANQLVSQMLDKLSKADDPTMAFFAHLSDTEGELIALELRQALLISAATGTKLTFDVVVAQWGAVLIEHGYAGLLPGL